jgi:hypothetical protein
MSPASINFVVPETLINSFSEFDGLIIKRVDLTEQSWNMPPKYAIT